MASHDRPDVHITFGVSTTDVAGVAPRDLPSVLDKIESERPRLIRRIGPTLYVIVHRIAPREKPRKGSPDA